jgi:hypothetical protein
VQLQRYLLVHLRDEARVVLVAKAGLWVEGEVPAFLALKVCNVLLALLPVVFSLNEREGS